MKQEIAELWATALESGQYQQGQNKLKSADNKFCCLGVLCDLYMKEHPNSYWERTIYDPTTCRIVTDRSTATVSIPTEVKEWSGMFDSCGLVKEGFLYSRYANLSAINDYADLTFTDIAQIIRKKVDVL